MKEGNMMRKTYSKPEILFEDFSLSISITVGCDVQNTTPSQDQCGVYFEGVGNVFITGMAACSDFPVDNGEFNGFCYHVPFDDKNIFNS